jgi:hypothetical protein
MRKSFVLGAVAIATISFGQTTVECVTFDNERGKVYAPIREVGQALGWKFGYRDAEKAIFVNDVKVDDKKVRKLFDGTNMIDMATIAALGAEFGEKGLDGSFPVTGEKDALFVIPDKGIEVSLADQEMRGWQGSRLVLRTNISSGRGGRTPRGEWTLGPVKHKMHHSSLYNNAAMPYAMQVTGNIFVHGYKSVPNYPASHGCIRMPLKKFNAAKYLFEWAEVGTPIAIRKEWSETARRFDPEKSDAQTGE